MNNCSIISKCNTPTKLNSSPSTPKADSFKYTSPEVKKWRGKLSFSEKVRTFFANKNIEKEAARITSKKTIDILNSLYEQGLNKNRFLIYGSVSQWLQNTNNEETTFGDIDIAVSHIMPYFAQKEFAQILDNCNLEYLLTGNTFSIINADSSFYNIQLVTREEKTAFPRSVLDLKHTTFEEKAADEIILNEKKYYCINERHFSRTSTLKLFIDDEKKDNKQKIKEEIVKNVSQFVSKDLTPQNCSSLFSLNVSEQPLNKTIKDNKQKLDNNTLGKFPQFGSKNFVAKNSFSID